MQSDKEDGSNQTCPWCWSLENQYICSQSDPGHMNALYKWPLGSLTQEIFMSSGGKHENTEMITQNIYIESMCMLQT